MRVLAVALWCLAGADDIAVIDGLFSRDEVRVLAAAVDSLAYTFDEQDHDAAEPAGSVAELPLNGELDQDVKQQVAQLRGTVADDELSADHRRRRVLVEI